MMKKKIKDGDILKAMAMHLDEDSVVFGANGHYAVGGYYDITRLAVCSVTRTITPRRL
jgi:hypothetical protein